MAALEQGEKKLDGFTNPFGGAGGNGGDQGKLFSSNSLIPPNKLAEFGGRRFSVSSESMNPETMGKFEKKVIPKSDQQMERIKKALENNFLFSHLDEEAYKDVIDAMEEKKITAGTEVIKQGAEGDFFYVVEQGSFEITKLKEGAKEPVVVLTLCDQGSFGELALMYNSPRAATVTATTDATLWALDRVTFRRLLMERTSGKRKLYESFLEEIPLLKGLELYQRQKIADSLESKTYDDGEVVIRQGDVGDCFYLVEDGSAKVLKRPTDSSGNPSGDSKQVGILKKGDYFGELALITNEPRQATIVSDGKLKVAYMSRAAFNRLLGPLVSHFKKYSEQYK
ncbi:cAMP-dependent protein kinase regulatory subunit [Zancudomyces culisetae]|uniref:cAMP-dependent protein kinase regulatory subunit n=1 Tax=Zancudomyces culisetae TaxID=1213189 RepID=A0A1R1PK06_ZANCU|nr:cAMP-dependent protein kinase regulatory subunit [Zancudomyces culisetae]|eukprot:OMH81301.1 cAMP-dependent protein kinase regulatory subunit [Zancudomyces culisetae]